MTTEQLDNINIEGMDVLLTPAELKQQVPLGSAAVAAINQHRSDINAILRGESSRLLVIVGPCSIHDPEAAITYGRALAELAQELGDQLLLVMRTYFEKPRTSVGWKGLINDPHLDDSFDVPTGLHLARSLLVELTELGLPLATEALDPIAPQYLQDLISWSAVGARTAESQTHREMASGLSCAVGFKNGTDGTLDVAINALKSVAAPHRFLGITQQGEVAVVRTQGNPHAHIVLRGGHDGPNYAEPHIKACEQELAKLNHTNSAAGADACIVVDCSHANSNKDHRQQPQVAAEVARQIMQGNQSIRGLMLESNLTPGAQTLQPGMKEELIFGQSVTDACMGWEATETLLRDLARDLAQPLKARAPAAS